MKANTILLFLVSSLNFVFAQTPAFEWAANKGGTGDDMGRSIAVDNAGNVYTTGSFSGTADFDPSPTETLNLTSAGADDIFVSKLSASGDILWAKRMGGANIDIGRAIGVDNSGNVYTTGNFSGTADFDPGAAVVNLTSTGINDIFISKLDTDGNFLWVKKIGGSSIDIGRAIHLDALGNIYLTGSFDGTVDFDPGPGVFNLVSAGGNDIFVLKLDATGAFVWAKQMGGSSADIGWGITVDKIGDVYTVGYFQGTADFDPSLTETFNLTSAGLVDVFVSKLSASGDFQWAVKMGGTGSDIGYSISIDTLKNSYITGSFSGTADFDPSLTETFNLTSAGGTDIFILKLDAEGAFSWAKQVGGTGNDIGYSLDRDRLGNIYTTGLFRSTVDFDPGASTTNLVSNGGEDAFVLKLDSLGNFVWVGQTGGVNDDVGNSIRVNTPGNIYTTGSFSATADFDPSGENVVTLSSAGGSDIFVRKLGQCLSTYSSLTVTSCNSYLSPSGKVFTTTQILSDTVANAAGCDSIITIDLTIHTIDLSVTQTDITLTANKSGASYLWMDCDSQTSIPSETGQSFTPSANGNYAVIITENTCQDTSVCYLITTIGVRENTLAQSINVYPNPTAGRFTIEWDSFRQGVSVVLTDMQGKVVQRATNISGQKQLVFEVNLPPGMYILSMICDHQQHTTKLVVK